MVLFKYTGGGQIEAPPTFANDLTVESPPGGGELLSFHTGTVIWIQTFFGNLRDILYVEGTPKPWTLPTP